MKLCEFLEGKSTLRIGFLGGSITEGAGASRRENRYSSRTVAAIARRFPEMTVEEINAGVGGTPSSLGVFRLERDVLEKKPDLLFVEFAVNDGAITDCAKYMEGIVRRALRYQRDLPIVFVYTFAASMYDGYLAGELPNSVKEHNRVAEYYNIPTVNFGPDLAAKIKAYGGDHLFFMQDGAHPNDDGYATYTDTLMGALFDLDFQIRFPEEPLTGVEYPHPHMEYASQKTNGWPISNHTLFGRTPDYVYSSTVGDTLTYTFRGTALGAYLAIEKDSGNAEIYIDGEYVKTVSTWDEYALRFNRACFNMLAEGLSPDQHTLTLKVAAEKNEKSEGHFIRIGAFLVADNV